MPLDQTIDLNTAETGVQTAQAMTSRTVSNTPDKGAGSITILADANALKVAARDLLVTDGDYTTAQSVVDVVDDGDVTISWQVSDNGSGGWTDVTSAAGTVSDNGDVTGGGNGQSKHYRAVATYDSDGPGAGTEMESVYSDPIRVANIRDDARPEAQLPDITGSAFPGGTLTVDAGAATVDVQWQMSRGTGDWTDIPGATGSLTLTPAHAGANIRAVVSYQSTSATSPGVTEVVAVNANGGTAIPGGTTATATPAKVDDHDIEVGVTGTGHHPMPGATDIDNNAGWNLSHTEEIDLSKLFSDPDSPRLAYTVASTGNGLADDVTEAGGAYVYVGNDTPGGVLVLEISGSTAKLTFKSDVYRGHDGNNADGQGNVLTLTINASDGANQSDPDADIKLRINVAPTGIAFNNEPDGTGNNVVVNEHVGSEAAGMGGKLIASVDVQDENADAHEFGTHEVTIDGDNRFEITNTGNGKTDRAEGTTARPDGSTWEVRLKAGEKLDYETQKDMDTMLEGKQIVLTLTATDGGGLSTPPGAANAIKLIVTIVDVMAGDLNEPPTPTPNIVQGLKGDDSDASNDIVDGDDDDADANPSMDAMMMSTLDDGLF